MPRIDEQSDKTVPAQSLRAFMSSIMRWRNGLMVFVFKGNSCLG
jgi:hypothetical protein